MNPKREDTPARLKRRLYEETHKEERRKTNANFQTMIKREDYNKIVKFLEEKKMSKVDYILTAFEIMQREIK